MNDDQIRWNLDKKRERDQAREQEKAKSLIGKIYASWKVNLCAKPRTRKEVLQSLYKLRDDILKEGKYLAENNLKDFSEMTFNILEEKISQLLTAHITGRNAIRQHVPAQHQLSGDITTAKAEHFRNKEELLAIDFVAHFVQQPGFTGFTWHRHEEKWTIDLYLLAHFAQGDTWLVGTLVNDVGLDDIPEYKDTLDESVLSGAPEPGRPAEPGEGGSAPAGSAGPTEPRSPDSGAPEAGRPAEGLSE